MISREVPDLTKEKYNNRKEQRRRGFPGRAAVMLILMAMAVCLMAGCDEENAADGKNPGSGRKGYVNAVEEIPAEEIEAYFASKAEEAARQQAAVEAAAAAALAEQEAAEAAEEEAEEEDPDLPPAEGMVRSAFTNEWIPEEVSWQRPLAVMYPINQQAQPQYGLNRISVFYEIMEEGSMSRQMGILEDWKGLDRIGNIRSIRDYFVYAALEYDPVIVHFGGPVLYVKDILVRADVDNVNGVGGEMGSDYGAFYRIPAGSRSEHTAYTDSAHLESAISRAGFQQIHRNEYYYGKEHFQFASKSEPNTLEQYSGAVMATEVDMTGSFPVTQSALSYNENDQKYYKRLYGNPQKDGATGTQLAFDNILIQKAYSARRDDHGYLTFQMQDSGRQGYFITRGKMIRVTWRKEGDYKPTRFFDESDSEIKVNTGRTMIFVIRDGQDSFTVNGAAYR